jgi:3-phytase
MKNLLFILISILSVFTACKNGETEQQTEQTQQTDSTTIQPKFITDTTAYDTDDPAIWVHPTDASKSLIIGTDKNKDGALYVYNLEGKIVNRVGNLQRPNNVDIEYGLPFGNDTIDIAVTTERLTHKLRVFKLPEMTPIDNGGIEVFQGETAEEFRDLMGIALYRNPENGKIYAIVGRKNGPAIGYLWQYELSANNGKSVEGQLVRKFGQYSQNNEIEAIAVDDKMGFVYYSDEGIGVKKYYANPEKGDEELSLFAQEGFADDHEGISIYPTSDSTGYILVSDQQSDYFRVFKREGDNEFITTLPFATKESDGSDCSSVPFNADFKKGIFVAMSEGKTFHIYDWETIENRILGK